jgi:hypothetical protein
VKVELWRDANGISGDGAEALIGWTFTNSGGFYYFSGQAPGVYQVKIPVSNFATGQPLAGSGNSSPITVNTDNQTDGDDNGSQPSGSKTVVGIIRANMRRIRGRGLSRELTLRSH